MADVLMDNLFKDIVETIRESLLILDSDLRVILASRSFYNSFQATPEETIGQHIYDLGNKEWDIPELRELLENILPRKTTFDDYEVEHNFPTIGRRTMLLNARKIKHGMSKQQMILLAIEDISESIQLKALLEDSEMRYRRLFETADDGILLLEKKHWKICDANPAILSMLGYSQEECIGSIMEDIGFTFHEGYFQELLPRLDKEGIVYSKDLPVLTKDNQTVDTDIYMVDKAALIQCNIRDITIKKQQAFEREQMFAAIEQAGEGIAITSPDGIIKYINPAFESITGYSKEETIGKNPDFLKSGLQDQKFYKNLWDTILSGSRWTGRLINNRKDGTAYTSECSISPIKDLEGNLLNFIWISKDITKEMALEKRIEQAQRMESIGILAGGIAHDFNNILSVIIGYTELAHDEVEKDSTIEEYLKEIHIGGIRAKTLVMQILGFARQSDETISPHRIDVIAKEVLKFIRSSIPATIEIQSDIQSDSLIMGNPTQVHQIFMNLCTNSAHAMKEKGGILKISLNDIETDKNLKVQDVGLKQGSYIQINVSDTGIGIPPDLLGRIFEPYFTTKPLEEGTGLGLALIHGIVESYGGKTIVESGLGKGTVFTIYLPITQKRKKVKFFSRKELPSGTESILLVDDEAPILKIEEKTLEHFGYSVTTSLSSVDALELFRSNPNRFDLVITDMTMPKMNGDKLAAALIKIRPDIPIVLFSGYSQKMSGKDITDIGIKAFVSKPVSKETMAKTVRKVLDEAKKPAQE